MAVVEQEDRRTETWSRMNTGRRQIEKKGGPHQPGQEGTDGRGETRRSKGSYDRSHSVFLFQLSHCLRRQSQATADPPWAHFTAQASINYQTRTLDTDRRLTAAVRPPLQNTHLVCCCLSLLQDISVSRTQTGFTQNRGC